MFVVWRRRAIKSDRSAELFSDLVAGRKFNGRMSGDWPIWTPLSCSHVGPGRVALTAWVMMAERVGGEPRQKALHRFAAIRTCCLERSPLIVGAWWHKVREDFQGWRECDDGDLSHYLARDKKAIVASLGAVVKPSKKADEEFRRYHEMKKQERWREDVMAGSPWEYVLGLSLYEATPDQAARKYRELAMLHHPDRGGDPRLFARINVAFEKAREACARPAAERRSGVGAGFGFGP